MKSNLLLRTLLLVGFCSALLNCSTQPERRTEAHDLSTRSTDLGTETPAPTSQGQESSDAGTVQIFDIRFTVSLTQYKAALWLKDGKGLMRVRYYKEDDGTVMIEQQMRVEDTQYGIRLTGYNPTDPATGDPVSYSPDNFYISRDENGDWSVTNIDDQGTSAGAFIQVINGWSEQNQFLSTFNWEID